MLGLGGMPIVITDPSLQHVKNDWNVRYVRLKCEVSTLQVAKLHRMEDENVKRSQRD